jgi:hypothetical protein
MNFLFVARYAFLAVLALMILVLVVAHLKSNR